MTGDGVSEVQLVDWHRTARRMRRGAVLLSAAALVAWLVGGAVGDDGLTLGALAGWFGGALGVMFVVEVVVVGGAALRGMLRAGERGERLASDGVGLLPAIPRRRDDAQ